MTTAPPWRICRRRTCALPSRMPWAGRAASPRRHAGWIWPRWASLVFQNPAHDRFPALNLAIDSMRSGGLAPDRAECRQRNRGAGLPGPAHRLSGYFRRWWAPRWMPMPPMAAMAWPAIWTTVLRYADARAPHIGRGNLPAGGYPRGWLSSAGHGNGRDCRIALGRSEIDCDDTM